MRKVIIIILAFLLVLFSLASCRSEAQTREETVDITEVEAFDVGEEVSASAIKWKVAEVEDLGNHLISPDSLYAVEAEEGKFINISFMIWNNADEEKQIFDLRVIDDKGRAFNICVEAYSVLSVPGSEACTLARILPETERTFNTTFDVAADSRELFLEVTGLQLPPEQKKYIDLDI
jgi:hypothetical protein